MYQYRGQCQISILLSIKRLKSFEFVCVCVYCYSEWKYISINLGEPEQVVTFLINVRKVVRLFPNHLKPLNLQ